VPNIVTLEAIWLLIDFTAVRLDMERSQIDTVV